MGLVVTDLITSPVVSWRGWEIPPPPHSTAAQLSFFAQPRMGEDLSLCGGLLLRRLLHFVYVWWMDWILFDFVSEYFLSVIFRLCQGSYEYVQGWATGNVVLSCRLSNGIPTPLVLGVGGKICTMTLTYDFCAVWSAAQWERFNKKRSYKERKKHRPSGSVPTAQQTSPRAETSSGVSRPGTSSSSSSRPLGRPEGSQGAPGVGSGGAPSPPARPRSSERGGSASGHSSEAGGLAPASPSPSGAGEVGAARSLQTPLSRASDFVVSPQFSPHVPRRENSRETSESCPRVLSSRGSRSSDRGSRKDKRARSRGSSSRSRSSSRSQSRGREHRRRSSSSSLSSRARSRRERSRSSDRYRSRRGSSRSRHDRSRSSDRYRSRRDRSRRERSRSVDRYRSRRQRTRSPARRGERRDRSRSPPFPNSSRDRSRSSGRLPGSPARLRAEETGRLARRETHEGVGAVASQPPVVCEAAAAVTPVAGGAALTALSSAVQDLARFFLGLSGSSSLGAIGGIAGVTASAAGSGGVACPSTAAAGAATTCATAVTPGGVGVSPAAPTAVPGVSGEQQRKVESRSRGRRSHSSSDGTDRRAKKRARRRSPSPGRSSRRRGRRYRSSSDSSEEDQADVSPPRSGRAHGGAPALLGLMIDRLVLERLDRMPGMTGTGQDLVVDPLRLRGQRMTTGLVRLSR